MAGKVKFCRNCGKELREGAKFCSGCGSQVVHAAPDNSSSENAAIGNTVANSVQTVSNVVNTVSEFISASASSGEIDLGSFGRDLLKSKTGKK